MEGQGKDNTDGSPIKPVSSLRSKFESMIQAKAAHHDNPPKPSPQIPPRPNRRDGSANGKQKDDTSHVPQERGPGRGSLDLPRPVGLGVHASPGLKPQLGAHMAAVKEDSQPSTPRTIKARPISMVSLSPPYAPPTVTVESPTSPPKFGIRSPTALRPPSPLRDRSMYSRPHSPTSPTSKAFKIPSRAGTPSIDSSPVPILHPSPQLNPTSDPKKWSRHESPPRLESNTGSIPPPINRAGKPKMFATPQPRKVNDTLAAPFADIDQDEKVSPFSTPPSEPESPPLFESPPPIPEHSKPISSPVLQARDNHFTRASTRRKEEEERPPPMPPRVNKSVERPAVPLRERILAPPVLPPRRDGAPLPPPQRARSPKPPFPPPEPPVRRSTDLGSLPSSRQNVDIPRPSLDNDIITRSRNEPKNLIPPRRTSVAKDVSHLPPPPPPPPPRIANEAASRSSGDTLISSYQRSRNREPDSDEEEAEQSPERVPDLSDFPDASQANRRPPRFHRKPQDIYTKYETKLFAINGEYICTTGFITKAWNIVTGDLLLSITHGDHVKGTAIAFKHAQSVEEEGQRVWIGTNTGELHEIDIPSKAIVASRIDAHVRTAIMKIHRHVSDMWTIDEEGKLMVWPTTEDGSPSLDISPHMYRIPPKATFHLIFGDQIWIAIGKGIWVYEHDPDQRTAKQITQQPLVQHGVGDVTSGTTISGQPDRVYFGHDDGRITMYSRKNMSFLGVVQVREYKISSLAGVGNHLWAGFKTGMIFIYDTTTQPWTIKKDWKAHEGTIPSILVDKSSIWKLDRLQVASLGVDGALKIWDGMLTDDWLEADMQKNDDYFCTFNEVTATIMTWNAGASTPRHLWHDERDKSFFKDLLNSSEPSDIYVFGFQELVDLEDAGSTRRDVTSQVMKKMFKRDKKKESGHSDQQERMRHQYRDWKDHLARELDEHMPKDVTYQLLHTANLVGLFTCIFVKDSIGHRISHLDGAQIRLGMGGRLGNKGALVVRFFIDDSSLCFLNCHLAAGQRHTHQRNNNVAAIMEAAPVPLLSDPAIRADSFVGGGDGSMVLDHEICILNGDLNYRIDNVPRDTIFADLKKSNLARLLERDQLLMSRRKNPGFRLRAFEEKPIDFAPTYKYDVGTDTYDTSEKQRAPAWCDRVLYRGLGRIKMEEYRRWEVRTSDHRPVSGRFRIRVKTVKTAERERVRRDGEGRFELVKRKIAEEIKLDYLINVFGMSEKEAMRRLASGGR